MSAPDPRARPDAVERFRRARRDPELAVLEGFHALKHALRFDAELVEVLVTDPDELALLVAELAPDVGERLREHGRTIDRETFLSLAPHAPRTGVIAIVRRPDVDVAAALADASERPVVLLEDPRNLPNVGACVRVAAAADAAAVLTTGSIDPWSPDALRGAAGLHFALPVARVPAIPVGDRALVAFAPGGQPLDPAAIDPRAILAFGTERHGLTDAIMDAADHRVRVPMRAGVSSLNLATSVAAALYACRLGGTWPPVP